MKKGITFQNLGELAIYNKLKKEERLFLESFGGFYKTYQDLQKSHKNFIEFLKFFIRRSHKTVGRIIASEEIVDEDPGYKIQVEYIDFKGEQVLCEYSSTIHWPSNEAWQKYKKQREVGQSVIIFYDPEATHICQLFFLDSWL